MALFDFEIDRRPGKDNEADGLSRRPDHRPSPPEEKEAKNAFLDDYSGRFKGRRAAPIRRLTTPEGVVEGLTWDGEVKAAQKEDATINGDRWKKNTIGLPRGANRGPPGDDQDPQTHGNLVILDVDEKGHTGVCKDLRYVPTDETKAPPPLRQTRVTTAAPGSISP
ncbi:hypothetical protein CORC01_13291 [Colletotrichum orchidophilum]|uniref:Uncharacterized protein n=1 Tax=Colletotrichum orchidophilum TaxID=1209926 RepID=A0A1G4AQQ0_9PEZI|nr:uncharacterized protein CORC01_13291 [Colletotrichum orchidophilum]OHE91426.1 hypothetical protein CORC01_13291 [Colletotrichum orchidophilum]